MFQKKQSRHGLEDCKNRRNLFSQHLEYRRARLFVKALPGTGLVQERKQGKGTKKFNKLHFS